MNERSDLDRALNAWFDDGPTVMPNRVIEVVADRIARQPQRGAWRLLPRRLTVRTFQISAGLAAVLIVAIAGWSLLARPASVGGPPTAAPTALPSPTAAPSPSATPFPCQNDIAGCAGSLSAGSHQSSAFKPALSFTTPAGWANSQDTPTIYELDPNVPGALYILVWSNAQVTAHTATCEGSPVAGVGTKPSDWVSYLKTLPGLVTGPQSTVKFGAYSGLSLLTTVKPGWTKTCPNFDFTSVQFLMDTDPVAGIPTYGAASGERTRNYFVDVAGRTVVIQVYTLDSDAVDPTAMADLQPVLDSIRFTP